MERIKPYIRRHQQLVQYFNDYFPYLWENKKKAEDIIIARSEAADKEWYEASMAGYPPDDCDRIANETLFAGYEFSPFEYIENLVYREAGIALNREQAIELTKKALPIFEKYGNDFEKSSEIEQQLIKEVMSIKAEG
jgi:hypothetical protein